MSAGYAEQFLVVGGFDDQPAGFNADSGAGHADVDGAAALSCSPAVVSASRVVAVV